MLTVHHTVLDAWSSGIVLSELLVVYSGLCDGELPALPAPVPYRMFTDWLSAQDHAAARAFWQAKLGDLAASTTLELPRPEVENRGKVERRLPLGDAERLRTFARRNGLTVNTIATASWAILLGRHSSARTVTFGITVSGRPYDLDDYGRLVGMFVNVVP